MMDTQMTHAEAISLLAEKEDELAELRAFKAACEQQEAVAWTTQVHMNAMENGYSHYIIGRNPRFVQPSGNDIPLYLHQDPEAAQLRMRLAAMQDQVAEACAKVCDAAEEGYAERESRLWSEMRTDAQQGIREVSNTIRAGEWRKYMEGK